jgi:hypothetical protein
VLGLAKHKSRSEELERLSKRKPTLRGKPAAKLPEGGMLLTRPCQDTDEKVMAELRVFNGVEPGEPIHFGVFEPSLLCDLIDCIADRFELIRCSRDLGYGRAEIEDMSITILQDGRVNMRRVSDENRVLELFRQIERAIFGSVICNCCGHDALSVIAGFAPTENELHPVLSAGSTLSLDMEIFESRMTLDEIRGVLHKTEALELLESAVDQLDGMLAKMEAKDFSEAAAEQDNDSRFCSIANVAVSSTDDAVFTVAVISLALLRAVENAITGLSELQKIFRDGSESLVSAGSELLSQASVGQLPAADYSDDIIEVVAHLSRVNRTINLLRDLGWRT